MKSELAEGPEGLKEFVDGQVLHSSHLHRNGRVPSAQGSTLESMPLPTTRSGFRADYAMV